MLRRISIVQAYQQQLAEQALLQILRSYGLPSGLSSAPRSGLTTRPNEAVRLKR